MQEGQIIGVNQVLGRPKEQSVYRSRLVGVLGSLTIAHVMCRHYDIQEGKVTIALDGNRVMCQVETG